VPLTQDEGGGLGVGAGLLRKTIWCISKYAVPLKYGYGHRLFSLAREFNVLGHRALVISSDSNHLGRLPKVTSTYSRETIDGVETWWIRTTKYRRSSTVGRAISWIDFEIKLWLMPKRLLPRPDVVIVSSLSLLTILNGYRLKRKHGCQLVFEVRDIWPLTIVEEGGFSRWNPFVMFLAWVERFGYRHSDVIVGTMPNIAEHVEDVTGKTGNCHCIPLGYDPELYRNLEPLPEDYEERYIPEGKFIVGYAGSIGITNALSTLVHCAMEMEKDDDIHFLLVGDGGLLDEYKARTIGLKNITFAPKVRKAQVEMILRRCQVLYFGVLESAVWRYGQSLNKLIDYMRAGKPIIASYSGYPSMVNEARCGVFVPARDVRALSLAICEYAHLPKEELEAIGKRGKDWLLEHRSYERIAEEYSGLF
jgi:glycosyltransferase involved in cell wall biosynthesis